MSVYQKKQQVIKTLSGNAFKVFYTLLELTVKEKRRNPEFDGWVKVSYNQLKMMTGVQSVVRVVDEFTLLSAEENPIIEIASDSGVSNRYRISTEIVNERME